MWSGEGGEGDLYDDEVEFQSFDRILGGGESDYGNGGYVGVQAVPLFYRVLKYGIFTLYLILFVEFVRHTMDSAARGRPFFTAVLKMVYSELATLGIVEFGVFLWGKYGTIDKDRKTMFADVHFALFLTAIFNALQYSLTSFVSTRLSNGLWVKTEQLELDHYVEIREEFDRVQEIIGLQFTGCGKWVRNCILFVCRPGLRQRHESLRVQVRFHELRLHFLESNNLSFSLKVSDYLKRSELAILIGLVHVSVTTWVLLIGILNVGYFIFGITGYALGNPGYIAVAIAVLFFVVDISFILLSWALRWKMRKIFQTVMKTKVIDTSDREEGIKNQNQLFWFGSPRLVISMIQLMNFGYAISISIVIIYWEYLNTNPGLPAEAYLIASLGCYSIFLYNLSALLPEYTLCTSLGYLTNQKELAETVAMHRLEQAERQRRKRIIENATQSDPTILQAYSVMKSGTMAKDNGASSLSNTVSPLLKSSIGGPLPDDTAEKVSLLVSDLVKIDTTDLRRNLPKESRDILKNREERIRQRRANRKKSVSDGVAAMRAWNQDSGAIISKQTQEGSKRGTTRLTRIRRTTSQPGVIQAWQNITASENQSNKPRSLSDRDAAEIRKRKTRRRSSSDPRTIQGWKESLPGEEQGMLNFDPIFSPDGNVSISTTKSVESNDERKDDWKKARHQRLAARRRARKKTQSASAIIQSWQDYSIRGSTTQSNEAVSEENYNSSDLRALSSDDASENDVETSKMMSRRSYGGRTKHSEHLINCQPDLDTLTEIEDHVQPPSRCDADENSDKKVIVDFSNTTFVPDGEQNIDDDNKTVDTDRSIGNLSDIDVIQAEKVGIVLEGNTASRFVDDNLSWHEAFIWKIRQCFVSPTYRNTSHVLGTSIVFCLIGSRVEVMLKISYDEFSPLPTLSLFWWEVILLSWFLFVDFVILVLFHKSWFTLKVERRLNLAAVIDILIVSVVMALFFCAEAKRCCNEQNGEIPFESIPGGEYEIGDDNLLYFECTCPKWGTRTYGGLGILEPFTALIFLRLFRFKFANYMIDLFCEQNSDETFNDLKTNEESHNDSKYSGPKDQGSHGHDNRHQNKYGSALELWERAIADFPAIVQKHGEFSSELLQAMLGVDVTVDAPFVSIPAESEGKVTKSNEVQHLNERENTDSHIKLTQSRYAKLPARAQGIVIAGSLRKPVKPIYPEVGVEHSSTLPPRTGLVDFEIDNERMHSEQHTSYSFVAPFAKLVRSMRRCDRRHLPLLKGWQCVDVVMTQFEIVYFEAIDNYCTDLDETTRNDCEACRLALTATKGGKNLRLCDVALGRKVVGHLDLADITEVHVAKDDLPVSDMTLVKRAAVMFDKKEDLDVEYWCNPYQETEANKEYARTIRWTLIQEERLKISTNSGTLFFRFYSDLAYFEAEKSGEHPNNSDAITRDIAFQWAETLSRICGRSQLRQNLPHFGEENEAELRDYLEVVHFHEKEAENERKTNFRGAGNVELLFADTEVELSFADTEEFVSSKKKSKHKRIKSMMDLSSAEFRGSEKNESSQERKDYLKTQQPLSKTSIEFSNVTQAPQKKEIKRSFSVGDYLNRADDFV